VVYEISRFAIGLAQASYALVSVTPLPCVAAGIVLIHQQAAHIICALPCCRGVLLTFNH
jgi:hypothetical protein